jgi:hypothetical protein
MSIEVSWLLTMPLLLELQIPLHCQVYYRYPLQSFPATGFGATGLH